MTEFTKEEITLIRRVEAPWSPALVKYLNTYQHLGLFHPYTCGGERMDEAHRAYVDEHGGDFGEMVATTEGWICPVCAYRQTWAHVFWEEKE